MRLVGKAQAVSRQTPIAWCERLGVRAVLAAAPQLTMRYPNGGDWLERRLDDLASGRARVLGIREGDRLAAVAIDSPKGRHLRKLSTFGVAPRRRSLGIGTKLLEAIRLNWLAEDVDRAYVTIDRTDLSTRRFFLQNGFIEQPELVEYGGERRDSVFIWERTDDALASVAFH